MDKDYIAKGIKMDYTVRMIRTYLRTGRMSYEVLFTFLESLDMPIEDILKKFDSAIEEWDK